MAASNKKMTEAILVAGVRGTEAIWPDQKEKMKEASLVASVTRRKLS